MNIRKNNLLNGGLSLLVKMGDVPVGMLAQTSDGAYVFQYSKIWQQEGFSISPFSLPLNNAIQSAQTNIFDGLHGIFSDSLPDGWGRLLVDRMLRRKGFNPATITPLERLALVGNSGMGALQYYPQFNLNEPSSLVEDFDRVAQACADVLHEHEIEDDSLFDELFNAGGSSGGARPKVFFEDVGTSWLVKFPSSYDPSYIGEMEYEYSCVARECGIDVPEARLFPSKKCSGYFGVQRFDRIGNSRIHMASVSALLETSHRVPNLDYMTLIKLTQRLTEKFSEIEKLFALMCFNVFAHNHDDHSKNFSFLYRNCEWGLAPAYDLTYSHSFGGEHSTTVAGAGLPGMEDIIKVGKQGGIPERKARSVAEEIRLFAEPLAKKYATLEKC